MPRTALAGLAGVTVADTQMVRALDGCRDPAGLALGTPADALEALLGGEDERAVVAAVATVVSVGLEIDADTLAVFQTRVAAACGARLGTLSTRGSPGVATVAPLGLASASALTR